MWQKAKGVTNHLLRYRFHLLHCLGRTSLDFSYDMFAERHLELFHRGHCLHLYPDLTSNPHQHVRVPPDASHCQARVIAAFKSTS